MMCGTYDRVGGKLSKTMQVEGFEREGEIL